MTRRPRFATRYTVVGAAPVLGHQPGESFDAELPPAQEARLFAAGHLAIGAGPSKPRRPAGAQNPRTRGGDTERGGATP